MQRPPLTDLQLKALMTPLATEDRESLALDVDGEEWVTEMLCFARAYGGQIPFPFCVPSKENFKKILDTVSVLASGEGVMCNYRGGAFDAGRKYTPKDDLDEALARALKWLPKAKDKSNGWTFTHPFEKMKQFQRALFWKHLFPFCWPCAVPSARAQEHAWAMAEAHEGEEAGMWLEMAEAAAMEAESPAEPGSAVADEQAASARPRPAEDSGDDDEESDAPLTKRLKHD